MQYKYIIILLFIISIYIIIYNFNYIELKPNFNSLNYNNFLIEPSSQNKYKLPSVLLYRILNKTYLVNNLPDAQTAANILAKIMYLINYLIINIINENININDNKIYRNYIKKINDKLPYVIIVEAPLNYKYTSYSLNKGEKIVLCIRDKQTLIIEDLNELLYVAIHEIAHIGCPEIGHTNLFININKYLLRKAMCLGIYKYTDYFLNNKKYCGLMLTSTILDNTFKC